jgi:hypothetical protein
MLLHLNIIKGIITCFCGSHKGTKQGGLEMLFFSKKPYNVNETLHEHITKWNPQPPRMEYEIWWFAISFMDEVCHSYLFMEHLLVDFKCAKVKHDPLKVHVCAIGHCILLMSYISIKMMMPMALSYNVFEILLKLDDIKQFIYITKASIYK